MWSTSLQNNPYSCCRQAGAALERTTATCWTASTAAAPSAAISCIWIKKVYSLATDSEVKHGRAGLISSSSSDSSSAESSPRPGGGSCLWVFYLPGCPGLHMLFGWSDIQWVLVFIRCSYFHIATENKSSFCLLLQNKGSMEGILCELNDPHIEKLLPLMKRWTNLRSVDHLSFTEGESDFDCRDHFKIRKKQRPTLCKVLHV